MAEQIIRHNCGEKFNGDCLVLSVGLRHVFFENSMYMSLGKTCTVTCLTSAFSSSDNLQGCKKKKLGVFVVIKRIKKF